MPFSWLSIGRIFFYAKRLSLECLSWAAGLLLGSWRGLQLIPETFKYLKDVQTKGLSYPHDEITCSMHREATRGPRIDLWGTPVVRADTNVRDRTLPSRPRTIARKKAMDNNVSVVNQFMIYVFEWWPVDSRYIECWDSHMLALIFFIVGKCVSISI